ncbi:hypothetical protein AVEN_16798-1 [Araneus ventricosus]|uniref:Uncharacterized protein n=1 Tax=Araneus ventricosus TaxID=182803 RepID=A0A4Y2BSY4_ARAVE|nr:hypothetical protein AVEN_16798-1 [Araneus ventricosus]
MKQRSILTQQKSESVPSDFSPNALSEEDKTKERKQESVFAYIYYCFRGKYQPDGETLKESPYTFHIQSTVSLNSSAIIIKGTLRPFPRQGKKKFKYHVL